MAPKPPWIMSLLAMTLGRDLPSNEVETTPEPNHASKISLLDLPGEIRNKIYKLAFGKQFYFVLDKQTFIAPAITRVCRQIRAESLSLYLGCSRFLITVRDYNMGPLLHFYNIVSPYIQEPKFRILVDFQFSIQPPTSRNHSHPMCPMFLAPLCRKIFTGELPFPSHSKSDQTYCPILPLRRGRALEKIADVVKLEAQKGATWEEANAILVPFIYRLFYNDENGGIECKCRLPS